MKKQINLKKEIEKEKIKIMFKSKILQEGLLKK